MVGSCDVVAVGAHPDDVELGCGGTIARIAAAGRAVGIVDLTAGELGTGGTKSVRASEAAAAADALGVAWRVCIDLPDGGLDAGSETQRRAIVEVLRQAAPRVVFLPHWDDPHPDHGAAGRLLRDSSFLAGVERWNPGVGAARRPSLVLAYPGPRQFLVPGLVIDVTEWYGAKRVALAAHGSQFSPAAGVPTHIASGHFLAAIEGRDRASGNAVGCELGEGFVSVGPVPCNALVWLLTEGRCESA
jgi:bacillithiol biosynthesis deacetylase BshB1